MNCISFSHTDPPRVSNITEGGCLVEWSAVKMAAASQPGEIHYKVQVTRGRGEQESKMVYTGGDLQWRVSGLEARADFTIRVAAVRVPPASSRLDESSSEDSSSAGKASPGSPRRRPAELVGAWSPPCVFTTLAADGGGGGGGAAGGFAASSSSVASVSAGAGDGRVATKVSPCFP